MTLKSKRSGLLLGLMALVILVPLAVYLARNPLGASADSLFGFNEGSGDTVNDSAGSASGTITNAVWRTEDLCYSGTCLYFDGSGDYVSFGDDSSFDFTQSDNFTLSFWFRTPDISSGTRVMVSKYRGDDSEGGYKVYLSSDGKVNFGVDDDNSWGPDDVATSINAYDDNTWHYVSAVKTGTTSLTLYVDGLKVGEKGSLTATGTLVNDDPFTLGMDADLTSNPYTGFLDELKVYTTSARTADEVKSDVLGTTSNRGTAAAFTDTDSSLSQGLVGYWKMDEAATPSVDSSGNGNSGTWSNTSYTTGKFGNSALFDNSADYIDTGSNSSLDNLTDWTYSFWINPTNLSPGYSSRLLCKIATCNNGGNGPGVLMETVTAKIEANEGYSGTDSYSKTSSSLAINTWTHVSVIFNSSTRYIKIYFNGAEQGYSTQTQGANAARSDNSSANLLIGNLVAADRGLNGFLDEVRVYNRALTPSEVEGLYRWAPGPVAYYKFDEGTGTTSVSDSSGNNFTGTMTSFTNDHWTTGKFGSGLLFDNGDHDNTRTITTDSNIGNPKRITAEAWVKRTGTPGNHGFPIAQYGGSTGWGSGWRFSINNINCLNFLINTDNVNDGYEGVAGEGNTLLLDTDWHHIAGVYDGSNTMIYLDGILQTQATGTGASGDIYYRYSDTLRIGQNYDSPPSDNWLPAILDEVKIYNYVRTPAQIIEDMLGGRSSVTSGGSNAGAVAHWKFDEGYGDTAYDSGTGGNNGDLGTSSNNCPTAGDSVCPQWSTSGKFGKALTFDGGSSDNVAIEDSDLSSGFPGKSGETTEDFTFSAWVILDDIADRNPILSKQSDFATPKRSYDLNAGNDTDSKVEFEIYKNDSSGTTLLSQQELTTGTWYLITTTYDYVTDGASVMKIYINGELDNSTSSAVGPLQTNNDDFEIGRYGWSGSYIKVLDGLIDEVKIYNFALTADQVKTEYNGGMATVFGSLSTDSSNSPSFSSSDSYCPPGQGTACVGPVAEWTFNEGSGTTANDTTGNGNTGTLTNGPTWENVTKVPPNAAGLGGKTMAFDGSNDYVTIPYTAGLDLTSNFTVNFWWSPQLTWDTNSSTNDTGLLGRSTTGYLDYDSDWAFFLFGSGNYSSDDDGRLRFGTYGNNIQTNTATWTANEWYHISVAYTDSNNATIYVNGKPDNYNSDYAAGAIDGNENNPLELGRITYAVGATSYTNYYPFKLDGLRIYDYVRSPAQIAWDYNQGAPLAHWKLDENQTGNGQTVYDSSGNGNNGTTEGGTGNLDCTVTGKRNTACDFDGGDDFISMSSPTLLDDLGPASFSFWYYPTGSTDYGGILSKSTNSGGAHGWVIDRQDATNSLEFYRTGTAGNLSAITPDNSIQLGVWHHVVVVWDDTMDLGGVSIYINGKKQNLTGSSGSGDPESDASYNLIFGYNQISTNYHEGKIDDVKIWNYALTQKQIELEYNQGAVRFGP